MIYTHAAAALVAAAVAATGAWQVQNWRYAAKEKAHVEQQMADQRASAAAAIRRVDTVSQAQSDAAARLDSLRRSAGLARDELDGLRMASEAAMRTASASLDACTATAAAYSRLLNQCGAEYQALGERADGHASDVRTLMQAWPK